LPEVKLNASSLLDPSFFVPVTAPPILKSDFLALLDCGSDRCFVDAQYVQDHKLQTRSTSPLRLRLLDGSSHAIITRAIELPIRLSTGHEAPMEFLVTPLDSTCAIVLGLDWLTRYNPMVDWVKRSLTFHTPHPDDPVPTSVLVPPLSENSNNPDPEPPERPLNPDKPSISIIGAAAYHMACKMKGSVSFTLWLTNPELRAAAIASDKPDPVDLEKLPEDYQDFADVFSKAKAETLAPHRPYDLKINLEEGQTPPFGPIYSLSQTEQEALREFVEENISNKFIRPTSSSHGAPVLFVKKKDGSLRLCVDYRALNKITKKDRYPLPLTKDLLDAPKKARHYTKIDLRHAYHLVRIAPGDKWKTAFRTRYGSFEWCVMPFGLTNAPAAFQHFMNDIFSDMLDVSVIVYLDDILIYSDDPESHKKHVREALRRLRKHGLYANADKCVFNTDTVEYLGFILSPQGLTMDPSKVKTIQDWPEPRKVKDIQSFLGFANFYRRFIQNYSEIIIPLTCLTRKNVPWQWTDERRSAFNALKASFISAPILAHFIPGAPLIVETDASDYAVAAILSTISEDKEIHPIAFFSRTLGTSELNYDTHDKELLAIHAAFKNWRHYLEGAETPIDVVTDHKNLEYFTSVRMLTRRQARWAEFLCQFNLHIRFRPGKLGTKPDSLTRRWDVYPKEGDSDYASVNPHNFHTIFNQEQLALSRRAFTEQQLAASLRASTLAEPVLRASVIMDNEQLRQDIRNSYALDPITTQALQSIKDNSTSDNLHWTLEDDGLLLKHDRLYVPDANDLRLRVLQHHHDHPLSLTLWKKQDNRFSAKRIHLAETPKLRF
jgi:hypothetical protein